MISEKPAARWPVFTISCWVLALMAFTQLLVAGMALATRFDESREVRTVIKEVSKVVVVRVPAAGAEPDKGSAVVSRPPVPPPVPAQPLPAPTPIVMPKVDDPRSERLVKEARQAIVAGDMMAAIAKLEDALSQSKDDPSVHFELGRVHEQMGVFDVAGDHYAKILEIGLPAAGALHELAANKLRDGFAQPDAMLGKLALGRVRLFKNPNDEAGEKVILTIPVQRAPAEEIDIGEIRVVVSFFNRTTKGEIVARDDETQVTEKWVTLPFDWVGGEESLRMTYVIPPQDTQTEHLFGERSYYGQVVSLMYKGEVLDVQAWPPALAAKVQGQPAANPGANQLPEFQDFDPSLQLLPPLPIK
ncbi:MAG: hypothetical protein V4819_20985 [Verrucomicrobiota bacterium]